MGKLNLGSDKTGASPLLTGFSVGEEGKMPRPGSFIFVAFLCPPTVGSVMIEAKGPYYEWKRHSPSGHVFTGRI